MRRHLILCSLFILRAFNTKTDLKFKSLNLNKYYVLHCIVLMSIYAMRLVSL